MQIDLITELNRNEIPTVYDALKELTVGHNGDFFDICEFLRCSTELQRKYVATQLDEWRKDEIEKYLDGFNFVNRSEVASAYAHIVEHIEQRTLGMGELGDLEDAVDYYISDRYIQNDDEEETLTKK